MNVMIFVIIVLVSFMFCGYEMVSCCWFTAVLVTAYAHVYCRVCDLNLLPCLISLLLSLIRLHLIWQAAARV